MVRRFILIFFYFTIFENIEYSYSLEFPLKGLIKGFDVGDKTSLVKALLKTLPFPKFSKYEPPQSAIDAILSGNDNEDQDLNITQLIKKNGFPVEKHEVVTADGYILNMFRIPNSGPPVLLMHGILSSSNDWATNGRTSSLSYLLADKGYDVWMGDARGNQNSRNHVKLDPVEDKAKFWDFSWDEIGRYDLPAMIDHILDITDREQLIYIGHSQGTTSFYVLCSEKPEYNDKVSYMVALAAEAFMEHIPSPAFKALAPMMNSEHSLLVKAVGPRILADTITKSLKGILCNDATNAVTQLICTGAIFLIFGFNYEQAHYERLPTILKHLGAGGSTKQFVHYFQSVTHGEFKHFDYGESENKNIYGHKVPPDYPLENIKVPMAIFHGKNDMVNDLRDVKKLLSRLIHSNCTLHQVPNNNFAHLDFLYAKDVKTLVYDKIMRLIEGKSS